MTKSNIPLNKGDIKEELNNAKQYAPFLLKPACKDYLWGGDRLEQEFGKKYGIAPLAETWECSAHPDGVSTIDSGLWKGQALDAFLKEHPECLGTHPAKTSGIGNLPILIKLIDAGENASVQVHPDDEYAGIHEQGANGKAEMWYILDSKQDARLVYGFYQDMDRETVAKAVEDQTIEKYLRKVKVRKDDVFFISPGQVHAIGAGIVLAEIQQNSNLTYRLYDYNRKDKDGVMRELHLKKALDIANLNKSSEPRQPMRVLKYQPGCATELLCRCKYFQVERVLINTEEDVCTMEVNEESFWTFLCLEGGGSISTDVCLSVKKGNCVFIPANCGIVRIKGNMQLLKIRC